MRSRIVLNLSLALALVACSSTKPPEPAPVATAQPAKPAAPSTHTPPASTSPTQVATVTVHPLDDPTSPLASRTVYFDFDSAVVKAAFAGMLEAHGKFIASAPTAKARLEGHTDERGFSEYNLALGQRRAEAVLQSLKLLGSNVGQLEPTSFGKEKPLSTEHDESAWAKERRVDIDYTHR